jgi:hypothetical protein
MLGIAGPILLSGKNRKDMHDVNVKAGDLAYKDNGPAQAAV